MGKRFAIFVIAFGMVAALVMADPAAAQYHAEGGFTVNPVNIVQGNTATVQGYCEIAEPVVIKLDNGATVGSGVVPGVNDPQPRDTLATALVTITITIPVATPIGPHLLQVYCHGVLIQTLNINVLGTQCNTTGVLPPPLGGVYGIYGGDPQGAAPAIRTPDPNTSFSGTVTSVTTGLPIPNATVRMYRSDGAATGPSTNTDVNGYYSFGKTYVTSGKSYTVKFVELGFTTVSSALTAYAGSPIIVNQAMQVSPGGPGISGFVTDSVTGQKLVNVSVRLWLLDSIGRYLATATDTNGHYNFTGVPQGQYQLQFASTGYATKWWVNAPDRVSSTVITLGASPQVASVTMTGLCKGNGTLISSLTDAVPGTPLTLMTGGVLLLMLGSWLVLADSKRRVARSRAGFVAATGSGPRNRMTRLLGR